MPTPPSSDRPLVSVVVTTFNHEPYIAETIRTVLAQTYASREIVVVDDGSTDRTPQVLEEFGDTIRFIRQPNEGVAGSRNRGIREAKGDLLAFLDGDDRWFPDKLQRQVDAFLQYPGSGVIACDASIFNGDTDTVTTESLFDTTAARGFFDGNTVASRHCLDELIADNFIATTTQVMVPRRVLDDVGVSDPQFPVASDYDLYLRIATKYPITLVREVLASWRYLPTSVSGPSATRRFRWAEDVIAVLRKHAGSGSETARATYRAALTLRSREIARWAYYYGDTDQVYARSYLWRVLRHDGNPTVALYLGGLMAPQWMRTGVATTARRFFTRES